MRILFLNIPAGVAVLPSITVERQQYPLKRFKHFRTFNKTQIIIKHIVNNINKTSKTCN